MIFTQTGLKMLVLIWVFFSSIACADYDRNNWRHWIDIDKDCQNVRAELLIEQSLIPVLFKRIKNCIVTSGEWLDPYSNKHFFVAKDVDIDHIVPLKWAATHGAGDWSKLKKKEFSNDTENLLIVSKRLNRQKRAKGPDKWLPPAVKYHCEYIKKFDFIVSKYRLEYEMIERVLILRFLENCKTII